MKECDPAVQTGIWNNLGVTSPFQNCLSLGSNFVSSVYICTAPCLARELSLLYGIKMHTSGNTGNVTSLKCSWSYLGEWMSLPSLRDHKGLAQLTVPKTHILCSLRQYSRRSNRQQVIKDIVSPVCSHQNNQICSLKIKMLMKWSLNAAYSTIRTNLTFRYSSLVLLLIWCIVHKIIHGMTQSIYKQPPP